MSTNENTPVENTDIDDLDAFSSEFFGRKSDTKEPASSEEAIEEVLDDDAPDEDTHSEVDTLADDEDEPEVEAVEEQPKPKKSRFQERIDELTGKAREAERREAAVKEQLDAILEKLNQNDKPTTITTKVEDTGPTPEDVNEDGTDKYPLGEFDPLYIRDLTRHTLKTEREAMKAQDNETAKQQEITQQRATLQAGWEEKLIPAQERYPDFHEKGEILISGFDGLDPAYGEYLTSTLMSMEYGTDVLYYLANNVDEAKKIVNSGAAKATMALGRIEAKFAFADEEKQKARPKVSKAPTPPAHMNKGSAVAVSEVSDDTDDLDAFSSRFFKKKR